MRDYKALVDLIARSDEIFSLGSKEQAPDPALVTLAESKLGRELPASYLWFLQNYGGGRLFGEEIFSIYSLLGAPLASGDVVVNSLEFASLGWIEKGEIAVMTTDYGELYAISTEKEAEEYPVFLYLNGQKSTYANSFAGFLVKLARS